MELNEDYIALDEVNVQSAFGNRLFSVVYEPQQEIFDLLKLLESVFRILNQKLRYYLRDPRNARGLLFWVSVHLEYKGMELEREAFDTYLHSHGCRVLSELDIPDEFDNSLEELLQQNSNYIRGKSGLVINKILSSHIYIGKYEPTQRPRGSGYERLPAFLERKNAIINVQNHDNRCFGYAILTALLNISNHPNRATNYTEQNFLDFGLHDIQYPVALEHIPALEEKLKLNINVFSFFDDEGKGRYPLYVSRSKSANREVDLLFWSNHYAWIKYFNRFMGDISNNRHQKYWCKKCLCYFYVFTSYEAHKRYCTANKQLKMVYSLPAPGAFLYFKNQPYQQRVPFVVYADFECLLSADVPDRTSHHRTRLYQSHIPCAIGFKVISDLPELQFPYEQYRGIDPASYFIDRLIEISQTCLSVLFNPARLIMKPGEMKSFMSAINCYLCGEFLGADRVRDHDHVTGDYRGAAHSSCNLRLKSIYKIVVFFHNFRGYDSHLIVQKLNQYRDTPIRVISQSMEKYLTLSFGNHIVFKDSYQFLQCKLETLAENLAKCGKEQFQNVLTEFSPVTNEQEIVLFRKGVFPYEYLDCWEKFDEKQLPPVELFFSKLANSTVSNADYEFAKTAWRVFQCKTIGNYLDLYLKLDVLLLADIFESFRRVAFKNYMLDPAHFVSSPQLAWDAMLLKTRCRLELISDPEIFRMIDSGIRGGICNIVKRYARANNKYLSSRYYDPSKPTTYLMYLDANNLYGYAMSEPMPEKEFSWVMNEEINSIDWASQSKDQEYGYILDCDLDYPSELHELHNDYPLAAERLKTHFEYLSERQSRLFYSYNFGRAVPQTKLIPNLFNKRNYICHYLNLGFYLRHGLRLVKINRAIKFRQSRWLAGYINTNSQLRAVAKNDFEKDFFKLMNNSVYGKTCENQKSRRDIRLVNNEARCKKLIEKPHCMGFRIFDENLAAIHMRKIQTYIDKPFYVGFSVLELSKLLMLEFHYDVMKPKYGDRLQLCFTDTDSLFYEIQTEDIYEDFWGMRNWFDYAGYPKSSKYYDMTNNKVIGKFKDELNGEPILEFVGLRPKMYSFAVASSTGQNKEKFRAKGISRAALKTVHHDDFLAQLNLPTQNYLMNRRIGSKLHKIYSSMIFVLVFICK